MSSITNKDLIKTRDELKKMYESIKNEYKKNDNEIIENKLKDIKNVLQAYELKSRMLNKSIKIIEKDLKIFDRYRGYSNSKDDVKYDNEYNFNVLLSKQKEHDSKYKQLQKYNDIDELEKLFNKL